VIRTRRHIEAAVGFLKHYPPILIMLGGSDDLARTETAARLAALVPPAPGAQVLSAGAANAAAWREAIAVLSVGVPVLLHGQLSDRDQRNATTALPSGVSLLPFWLDSLPPDLDPRIWRIAEAAPCGLAAMAAAVQSWSGRQASQAARPDMEGVR